MVFEFFSVFLVIEVFEFFFFSYIGGEFSKIFVEMFGRFVKDIDIVNKSLVNCVNFSEGGVFVSRDLDKFRGIEVVEFDEFVDLFDVVFGVDVKSFIDFVSEIRVIEVEFDVEDVMVVFRRCKMMVFFDGDGCSFDREVRV